MPEKPSGDATSAPRATWIRRTGSSSTSVRTTCRTSIGSRSISRHSGSVAGMERSFSQRRKTFTLPSARPAHGMSPTTERPHARGRLGRQLHRRRSRRQGRQRQGRADPGHPHAGCPEPMDQQRGCGAAASDRSGGRRRHLRHRGQFRAVGRHAHRRRFQRRVRGRQEAARHDRQGGSRKVTIKVQAETKSGLKTASVLGTLPGTTDEDVFIIAHIDGYFEGALDNASGVAVMMDLMEHYAKLPQSQRRRNIRFMGSAGHHGGPGTAWLHEARETELGKTVLLINLEHVAAVRTKYWGNHLRKSTGVSPMRWWV